MTTEPAPESSGKHWLTRNVMGLSLASFFSDMGHEMITAMLPGFLISLGAPPIGLGVIEGVSNFGLSVAELVGGRLADRERNRAPWIDMGYIATLLKAAIALVPAWPWIVLIRTVAWFGRGARGPLRDSLIADDVPKESWGKAYGFREALDTAGAFCGPVLVAILLTRLHYRLLIGLSAIPALVTIAVVFLLVREVPHRLSRPTGISLAPVQHSPSFRRFLIGSVCFAVGYIAPTFFILRAIQLLHGHGALAAGGLAVALYAVHNLFYAGVSFPAGLLADRVAPRLLITAGFLLWVLVLLIFAVGPTNVAVLAIPFVLSGTATALVEPVQTTWAAQLLPQESRGRGLGLLSGMTGFAQLASGLVVGFIWTALAAPPAFLVAAVFAVGGLLIVQTVPTPPPSRAA